MYEKLSENGIIYYQVKRFWVKYPNITGSTRQLDRSINWLISSNYLNVWVTHTHTHTHIYNVCMHTYIYIDICVFWGSVSSLRHIWLNSINIFWLQIFVFILSSCRMDVIISSWNWQINLLSLIDSHVFSAPSWATIIGQCVYCKIDATFPSTLPLCTVYSGVML